MLFHTKSPRYSSSRQQIQIKEIRDGILVLPNNEYCIVLETSSVNFELKSEDEQDVILESFQNFLNSLPFPIQIIVRTRELDVDTYLASLVSSTQQSQQLQEYCSFVKSLISGNKILSRRFFIVLPFKTSKHVDFALVKEQLQTNKDIVSKDIEKIGMKVTQLQSIEVVDLFYSFYNSHTHKIQSITTTTTHDALENSYGI